MDDIVRMSFGESARDLPGVVDALPRGKRTKLEFFRERGALVIAHDDEKLSIGRFFEAVNHADIGVIERGGGFSFLEEALRLARTDGGVVRKEFQRDGALEFAVERLINHTHAARSNDAEDLV